MGDDPGDEAHRRGLVGVDDPAGEEELGRPLPADELDQPAEPGHVAAQARA